MRSIATAHDPSCGCGECDGDDYPATFDDAGNEIYFDGPVLFDDVGNAFVLSETDDASLYGPFDPD